MVKFNFEIPGILDLTVTWAVIPLLAFICSE